MNIKYVVPSYRRYDELLTYDYLSKAKIYVSETDYPKYIKKYDKNRFEIMPDEFQGKGKAIANNWILDKEWDDKTDAIVMLDDDIKCVNLWTFNDNKIELSESDFYEVCQRTVLLAKEFGVGLFCFNRYSGDRLKHNPCNPFKLHSVGGGALIGLVQNDGLRFDEQLFTSEDIDIQLQSMKRYKKILMVERYYLDVKRWTNKGGYYEMRDGKKTDIKGKELMIKKWGPKIIREKNKNSPDYSIRVGLKGV